jgi:hypothetical protein
VTNSAWRMSDVSQLTRWSRHVFFLMDMMHYDGRVSLINIKNLMEEEWRELFDNGATLRELTTFKS